MRILYIPRKQVHPTEIDYGLLYNWYAAADERNIANTGWHVPTQAEWITLSTYLGGASVAGGKLKESGLTYWNSPNTGATNEVGFNLRGGATRNSDGGFTAALGSLHYLWCSDYQYTWNRYVNLVQSNSISISHTGTASNQAGGIRPVKNVTTLAHGKTGTYVGNDGKIYRTVCIGTQEWLADNLAETKFRNGDLISEVTDNEAWTALTTPAMCAYNNDWSNVLAA